MSGPPVRLLEATDAAWDAALAGHPHDVYHRAGYHRVAEAAGEGRARLVVVGTASRGLAWPSLVRPIPDAADRIHGGATDVSSVYGYPGPVAWGCGPGDGFLADAWVAVVSAWRAHGAIAAFTRFHPLLGNAALLDGLEPPAGVTGAVLPGGQTVSIDCTLPDDEIRATYAPNLRREIDAARRVGLRTEEDGDWNELETFSRLYEQTMARSQASAYYFFTIDDFRLLREALGGHLHLMVTRLGDEVAAAGLFTELDGLVQTHLVATNGALLRYSPYKVLVDDVRAWARDRGDGVLHLGGGRGGQEDSLFWFKSRFSARRHAFHTGRWILDEGAYRTLAPAAPPSIGDGFFPAYRAVRPT
jgi:hypothetical protein